MEIYGWIYLVLITIFTALAMSTAEEPRRGSKNVGTFIGYLLVLPIIGRAIGWF